MTDTTARQRTRRRLSFEWLGVAPFIIFAVLFLMLPTLYLVGAAFIGRDGQFTLENIAGLFTDQIIAAYWISIRISGASAILGALVGLANEKPGFCQLVAADNGSAVALWIRNIAQFTSPRHLHAQKVDPNGALLWNGGAGQVVVFNQSVPIAHDPRLLPDGSGGAFVGWHRASGNAFSCFVQHLDGTGAALLTANGFEVTVDAAFNRMDPSIALDPGTGDLVVALRKMDSNQTNRGLVAQRITPAGVRSWGATGKLLEPVDLVDEGFPRVQCVGTDSIITWFTTPTFGGVNSAIRATRLDANGLPVWAPAAIDVCSVLSPKDDPVIARGAGDSLLIAWTDERNATFDVYGERLNADGTLGTPVVPCPADLNGDGQVNGADLGLVIGGWGQPGPADLNGDGTVDGADLGMVIGTWGPCS